jgi:hypothetical protein
MTCFITFVPHQFHISESPLCFQRNYSPRRFTALPPPSQPPLPEKTRLTQEAHKANALSDFEHLLCAITKLPRQDQLQPLIAFLDDLSRPYAEAEIHSSVQIRNELDKRDIRELFGVARRLQNHSDISDWSYSQQSRRAVSILDNINRVRNKHKSNDPEYNRAKTEIIQGRNPQDAIAEFTAKQRKPDPGFRIDRSPDSKIKHPQEIGSYTQAQVKCKTNSEDNIESLASKLGEAYTSNPVNPRNGS